ncbi:MAG: hypothetical protein NW207_12585 [Cytophagales bacterium]|nr:hypothetical protein [Cytophagales bacterium]
MNMIKKISIVISIVLGACQISWSQNVEMADNFRKEGKIYVVIATICMILVGIAAYLLWLEKRLNDAKNK